MLENKKIAVIEGKCCMFWNLKLTVMQINKQFRQKGAKKAKNVDYKLLYEFFKIILF